ncbi:MAG: hypothetical protein ACE5HB_05260 [Terriglobia bacterium]
MSLADKIRGLEQDITLVERVAQLTERILAELMKASPPPADLEKVHGYLRSASDLLKHAEEDTAQQLAGQAEEALGSVQQWLAVADLGVSPFVLRNFLEKNRLNGGLQIALVSYFLRKQPHAENDRDKLDYLLTAYFAGQPESVPAEELPGAVEELFEEAERPEISAAAEIMVHELESLIVRIQDFTDFDQLVHARMVERARTLKINLGEDFYHPRVLPAVIRFNLAFRRHFEHLFHEQLSSVRQLVRQHIEEAWELTREIEAACEELVPGQTERAAAAIADQTIDTEERVGRPLDALDERPPIDRLVRRGEEPQKENELQGIVNRLTRFLKNLSPDQAKAEKVVFPLRESSLELAVWEREAFVSTAAGAGPESARTVQYALGVIAWMEEELARYKQTRDDRYLWKTHFDHLSYAVTRTLDVLKAIRGLIRQGAPPPEVAWFGPLLQTALRLSTTLNHLAPVFAEPASS